MDKTSIGNRMKGNYENRTRAYLPRRIPAVIRLDGKAFHTVTKKASKPFDERIRTAMVEAMLAVCKEVSGAKIAYTQSDEISVFISDYDSHTTEAYVDYNIQKIVSITASIAAVTFSGVSGIAGYFDCRAFSLPKEEITNYFLWRQRDWVRNSVLGLGQKFFSQKKLHGKKIPDVHEMLHEKGVNWEKCSSWQKNGTFYLPSSLGIRDDLILNRDVDVFDKVIFGEKDSQSD